MHTFTLIVVLVLSALSVSDIKLSSYVGMHAGAVITAKVR